VNEAGIEVARATPDRLAALAPLFGRAFVNEPMMRWPMGDAGDVVDRFSRCFAYFLEEVLGLGLVWEVGDAKGAAVWVPPNRSEAWKENPWNQPRIGALADDDGRAAMTRSGTGSTRAAPTSGYGSWIRSRIAIVTRCRNEPERLLQVYLRSPNWLPRAGPQQRTEDVDN